MPITSTPVIEGIKHALRKGYVLHIDPDYLIEKYGPSIFSGRYFPGQIIGKRYAMVVGIDGDVVVWTLLTCSDSAKKQMIPREAKVGAWEASEAISYFSTDHFLFTTKDMALESFLSCNTPKSRFTHNSVRTDLVQPWPSMPGAFAYPRTFEAVAKPEPTKPKPAGHHDLKVTAAFDRLVAAAPVQAGPTTPLAPVEPEPVEPEPVEPEPVIPDVAWNVWVKDVRMAKPMTMPTLVAFMATHAPSLTQTAMYAIEAAKRLFDADELAAWLMLMSLDAGDPMVQKIPVLTESELAYRRDRQAQVKVKSATHEPTPAPTEVPVPRKAPKPAPKPKKAVKKAPAKPAVPLVLPKAPTDRQDVLVRAQDLLSSTRLTDAEAAALVANLQADVLALFLGAKSIQDLKRA